MPDTSRGPEGIPRAAFAGPEEAQACFAEAGDGNYVMVDLLRREDLTAAILFLTGALA